MPEVEEESPPTPRKTDYIISQVVEDLADLMVTSTLYALGESDHDPVAESKGNLIGSLVVLVDALAVENLKEQAPDASFLVRCVKIEIDQNNQQVESFEDVVVGGVKTALEAEETAAADPSRRPSMTRKFIYQAIEELPHE